MARWLEGLRASIHGIDLDTWSRLGSLREAIESQESQMTHVIAIDRIESNNAGLVVRPLSGGAPIAIEWAAIARIEGVMSTFHAVVEWRRTALKPLVEVACDPGGIVTAANFTEGARS